MMMKIEMDKGKVIAVKAEKVIKCATNTRMGK